MKKRRLLSAFLLAPAVALAIGQAATQEKPQLVWGDFDGDELPDLLTVEPAGTLRLHRNRGDGTFEERTASAGLPIDDVKSASWQDVDGDGVQDLFLLSRDGRSQLYRGLGSGTFEDATEASGLDLAPRSMLANWVDFDRDGAADLELLTRSGVQLLRNDGSGFLEGTLFEWTAFASESALVPLAGGAASGTSPDADDAAGSDSVATVPERARPSGGAGAGSSARRPVHTGSRVAPGDSLGAAPSTDGTSLDMIGSCPLGLRDNSHPGRCVAASSVPTEGMLYPLGDEFFVDIDGDIGFGVKSPRSNVHLRGAGTSATLRLNTQDDNGTSKLMLLENSNGDGNLVGGTLHYEGVEDQLRFSTLGSGTEKVRMVIERTNGHVGIGTTEPAAGFHVVGNANVGSILIAPDSVGTGFDSQLMMAEDVDGSFGMKIRYDGSDNLMRFKSVNNGVEDTHMTIGRDTGRVGIGVTNPGGNLEVVGDRTGVSNAAIVVKNTSTDAANALKAESNGSGTTAIFEQNGTGAILKGNTGAGTVFRVNNSGRVVTTALEITGGGDLVEGFQSDEELAPGTVVAVDAENPGQLTASEGCYDAKVVGIVSGAGGVNHGIRMGQHDVLDGDVLVAMAGRVWVQCTAENGAIRPGDLLTSASVAGQAMRATDSQRSFGAVIGKALSGLDAETGLVLVLVNLQ